MIRDNDRNNLIITNFEEKNKGLIQKMTGKRSDKPLSKQDIALQEFIVTGIDKHKVVFM